MRCRQLRHVPQGFRRLPYFHPEVWGLERPSNQIFLVKARDWRGVPRRAREGQGPYLEASRRWSLVGYYRPKRSFLRDEWRGPSSHSQVGAPMSGVVVEIRVKDGGEVKKGDPIAVLSAMKMEMVISAPHAGKVGSIQIKEGDSVGGSDLICKIVKPGDK